VYSWGHAGPYPPHLLLAPDWLMGPSAMGIALLPLSVAAIVFAIINNRLYQQLHQRSLSDDLTGILSRRGLREHGQQLLARQPANSLGVALLMIDIDHFKSINDRHGHLVGDDCLRKAAQRIGSTLRPYEALLARFGGEEFVVVLPDTALSSAVAIAESIRQALVSEPCESQGFKLRISASIGVHTITPDTGDDMDDALEIADKALYAAKANRDCVRTSITAA
jgi:two-component system, sensor histidine kinase LadS